jgi:ABC-type multidrug transport system fused ATPase/permease subunit
MLQLLSSVSCDKQQLFASLLLLAVQHVYCISDLCPFVKTAANCPLVRLTHGYTRALIVPTAVFTGIRGGIFTVIGARVNVRIRQQLFDSLVRQEIGFFDTTKTVSAIPNTTLVHAACSINAREYSLKQ